ncbi:XdhC family protein, partial [Streptomyces zhihengii]|uniref:XdhC family protein n=1 Tax=Streptomyces zhihengii TaxID=1818004 RepID=UPI0033AE0952
PVGAGGGVGGGDRLPLDTEQRVPQRIVATEAELARLRSPIGLDLGGRGAEETALSIMAEIVAVRRGGSGAPLTEREGPVHGS